MSTESTNNRGNGHRKPVTTVKRTGIQVLDRIYDLEKDGPAFGMGHFVPDLWSHVFLDERGRPHWLAMMVFAEIWFRHRPRESRQIRDNGDRVIILTKGFDADRYQFNRAELAARFNTSADAISRVLTCLVDLGVIHRDREDADFNHRGFRNVVYVTPNVDKLLELVAEAQKIVNKDDPNAETEENAHNTDRRDLGNVAHITPATLPASPRQRGPHDAGDVAPLMGAVSKESSERSSVSAVFAAGPQNHLETSNNNTSSAPQAAQPSGVGVAAEDWEASPPKPTGKDGAFGSTDEKVKAIRYHIGKSYLTWYGHKPDLAAKEFEDLLVPAVRELDWGAVEVITVIRAGWLWAIDAPKQEPDKTFIPGFYSKRCDGKLRALFQRGHNEKKLFLWHLRQELKTQTGGAYDIRLGNMTGKDANLWWEREMIERGSIPDESKYYDKNGRELPDPFDTTWTGIKRVVERWQRHDPTGGQPEQEWIAAVVRRQERDGNDTEMPHRSEYEWVKETLERLNLVSPDVDQGQPG